MPARTASGGCWAKPGANSPPARPSPCNAAEASDDTRLRLAAKLPEGVWAAKPESDEEPFAVLERVGRVPLPPYIRKGEMVEADRERLPDGVCEDARRGGRADGRAAFHRGAAAADRSSAA